MSCDGLKVSVLFQLFVTIALWMSTALFTTGLLRSGHVVRDLCFQ